MTKVSKTRWLKFISPLLITAMILSSLVVFPSSAVAYTASLERDGAGSLGEDRYLLGEWITFTGSVDFATGEAIDIDSINFVVDGPEPLNVSLPVEEGTHSLGSNLIVIVTWNNVTGESNGYGYGYSLAGGVGGGSIDYEIQWRPAYMLSSPDAELPSADFGWNVPDVPGLSTTKKVQGIASDGTNLYLLVDGVNRDIIIKTDLNGNVLGYFNAPNKEAKAIAYLDGDLYVYAEGFQRILNVSNETPIYEEWSWNGKYKLPTVWNNNMDNDLIETSLVVTADGEPVSLTNVNANDGSFDIAWGDVWDDKVVRGPSVVKVGTSYHMWYYSDGGTGGDEKIGHAISADGVNWTKDTNNPVMVGDAGTWDASGVLNPSVVYDSNASLYKMWYIGHSDLADHRVGYATSPDGINWTKASGNPVLNPGTGDAWDSEAIWDITVLINGSLYEMWYTATSVYDVVPKIGYASSANGTTWQGLSLTEVKIYGLAANDFVDPTWSPDGSKLAAIKSGDLWVVNADGSGATNITGSWSLGIINETVVDDTATGANGFSWTGSSWTTDTYWDYNGGSAQYSSNPPSPIVTPESDSSFTYTGDWWDEVDWGASDSTIKYANNLPSPIVTPETPAAGVVVYTGTWDQINDLGANGGKYRKLTQSDNSDPLIAYSGGSVSFTFSGTEVALRYVADNWGGMVGVSIDGVSYDNIDMYYQWWTITSTTIANNLTSGQHTLTITQLNEKSTSSWGYRVSVDGIETPNPVRNSVSITFTGTEVSLRYKVGGDMGRASVTIDGVSQSDIEMYNPSWNLTTRTYSNLSAGSHTMTITQLTQRHNLSNGYRLYVDGIQQPNPVVNTATVTFTGTGVKLQYKSDWDGGRLGVTIDGTDYGYVEMYNSGWQKKETTISDSLSNAAHTMVLTQMTDRNSNSSGYRVYVDGIKVYTPATLSNGTESSPAWHPTENRIAFTTNVTGKKQLFEVNVANLTSPVFTRITNDTSDNEQPTWAPGGDMIAFSGNRGAGYNNDILVIEALDGGGWSAPWSIADDWQKAFYNPDWSPDGNYVAFNGTDIDVVQVDENGQASGGWSSITGDSTAVESHPSWNSDSTKIAYASKPTSNGVNEVWVLTYNVGNPWQSISSARQLTSSPASDEKQPDWSADGAWITYTSNRSGNYEIWKINNIQTNPLLSPASGQGWDGKGLFNPTVLKKDNKYYMWYVGAEYWGSGRKTIGFGSSDDGKTWTRNSDRVFDTQWNQNDNWEDWHVYDPMVISDSGYKMYYAGQNGSNESAIGRAASANGTSWVRNAANPLLEAGRGDSVIRASYSYKKGWPENSIVKIDGSNGSYIKHFQSPNQSQIGGLAASDTDLYAVRPDFGNEIWQIDPENGSTGSPMWLSSDKGYWINGGDALEYKDGNLYLSKNGEVFVIDLNGNKVTDKYSTGLTGINGLGFLENTIYIGASSGPGKVYKSAIPGTVEKSTIGDYQAWIDADDTTSDIASFSLEKLGVPVELVITEPEDGDASQTPEVTIAGEVNDPSIDRVLVGIALPSTNLLGDDMEKGDSSTGGSFAKQSVEGKGWKTYSTSNLWNISSKRSLSGGKSWGYNKTDGFGYNTPGFANAGAIVSKPFNIGDGAELRFWTSWDTDSWVDVDRKLIDIDTNGDGIFEPLAYIVDGDWYPDPFNGARQRVEIPMAWQWKADGTSVGGVPGWNWYEGVIDLSAYAGAMDAKIRFRFDTMDDWMNDFEGWYIDDVTVTGAGFKGIYADVTELEFSTSYTLAEGYNTITVTAQSSYITGDQGWDDQTITVSLDTTGPNVILNPMVPNTRQGSVEVSGSIYELNFDNLVVSINDKPFYTLNSIPTGQSAPQWTFSTQVPLFEGENIIKATGTDSAGLIGSDTITIIRDSTAPTIKILPTVYFLGENAARTGDLLVLQLDAIDLSPADTDYEPAGVAEVLMQNPGDNNNEGWIRFIPSGMLPEAIVDQWGTIGGYVLPITIPENEDVPPGNYSFTIKAIDNAGNESISTVSVLIVSTLSAYNTYLMPEWNLISLPLIPDDADMADLVGDVEGVVSVWYYDADSGKWDVYTTDPAAPDTLTTMETGKGYWVYMDDSAFDYSAPLAPGLPQTPAPMKFSYEGQVLRPATVPPTYALEEGWNLIGLHSERSKPVSLYLRPVTVPQQIWASLLQYDNYINFEMGEQEGEGGSEIYLGSFRTLLDSDDMVPGKGFWLYVVEPGNVVAQP